MKTYRSTIRYSDSGLPHVSHVRDLLVTAIHQDGGEEMGGVVVDVTDTFDKNNGPVLHIREVYGNSTDRTFRVRYRQITDLTVWDAEELLEADPS
jgi:predicted RNA-binding protein with RPS1 domain